MNGSVQLLSFLVAALAAGVASQANDKCLQRVKDYFSENKACADYDAFISCLYKDLNDPDLDLSNEEIQLYNTQLNYFHSLKSQEDQCPGLKKAGSCLHQELRKCMSFTFQTAIEECDVTPKILECYETLSKACTTAHVQTEISYAKEIIESCKTGHLKYIMNQELCDEKLGTCLESFYHLHQTGRHEEAKELLESSKECLDNVTCKAADYLEDEKKYMANLVDKYNTGLLTGKCTWTALEKCHLLFYHGSDQQPPNVEAYHHCLPEYHKKGVACMEAINSDCVTKDQKAQLNKLWNHVDMSCTYGSNTQT